MENTHETWTIDTQKLLLEFLIADPTTFARARSILRPDYFENKLIGAVKFILDYTDEYNTVPTPLQIKAFTSVDFTEIDAATVGEHYDWVLENIEKFCQYKAIELAVLDGMELLQKGEGSEVERRVKDAMTVSLMKDIGTYYFNDPLERLKRTQDCSSYISTGWKDLDEKLNGGFTKGALNIFMGQSGKGKSLFLANMSLNWVERGMDVMYVSLELSEDMVANRFDAMVTKKSTKALMRDITNTAAHIRMVGKNCGSLIIKKLPEAGTCVNDLKALLKEYQIKTGKLPDAVAVDYIDLLYPNNKKVDPSNLFIKDKFTSEELRGMAGEFDILLISASQMTRCLKMDTLVEEKTRGTVRIDSIKVGDSVKSINGFVPVKTVFPKQKQMAYRIKTKSGKEIVCGINHRFPTENGLKSFESGLKIGDMLCSIGGDLGLFNDEIISIEMIEEMDLIDIEIESDDHLFFANGILTHNSSIEVQDFDQSHIAGGISKINTADNIMAIHQTSTMRENGTYQLQFLKTRSAGAVDQKITLKYNPEYLRIVDSDDDDEEYVPPSKENEKETKSNISDVMNKINKTRSMVQQHDG